MKHLLTRVAAAALLGGGAMSAQAVTLTLSNYAYGGNNVNVTSTGIASPASYGGGAGAFAGTLSGAGVFDSASFVTYCAELEQSFGFGSLPGYALVTPAAYNGAGANGWGANSAAIGNRLGQLLTYALPTANTSVNSTSLQLAIWNTIYDTDNTVASGAFTDVSGYAAQADAYLSSSLSTVSAYQIGVLTNSGAQDFVAFAPVPEPGTYVLMAAGLAGVGFVARRRTRRV